LLVLSQSGDGGLSPPSQSGEGGLSPPSDENSGGSHGGGNQEQIIGISEGSPNSFRE
jgi:hypothetical protein